MDHTCTRKLFCELTADELLVRGNELVTELTGITKLEFARSRVNAKIKPKKERVDELAVIIEQKKEERDVKCEWFFDWDGGKKTLHRLDTYGELETDIIREWERQQHFKFTGETTPGGYDVSDGELTETVCPKCNGSGEYEEDGGKMVYCECPAGEELEAKELAGEKGAV
jgi:hypothetical protein